MTRMTGKHMINKPYIQAVISNLQDLGYAAAPAPKFTLTKQG